MKGVMNIDETVVSAVTSHMNGDHPEDNLVIAKAYGHPDATSSTMIGLDADAGVWMVTGPTGEHELRIEWLSGPIMERPDIRREAAILYRDACRKLGVSPRVEHEPASAAAHAAHGHGGGHGGRGHGHGAHGAHGASADGLDEETGPKPFSQVIRESSWGDHSSSEGSAFMEDIMRGVATKQDYIDLAVQHYFMYVALEEVAQQIVANPAFASFHPEDLERLGALEHDLEYLLGADWRDKITAVPATKAYVARILEVGADEWLPGIVAHHYTRYLGDLSGGQMISKRVSKQHGFDGAGVEFYDFEALGSIADFKNEYRDGLDRLGDTLDDAEKQRMQDEVTRAYGFNTAVFVDLAKQKAAAAE